MAETEFQMEVYVLLNVEIEEYLDDVGYTSPSLYHACWWTFSEDAEKDRLTLVKLSHRL
jgi:hypothetical protein